VSLPLVFWEQAGQEGVLDGFTGAGPDRSGNMAFHAGGFPDRARANRKMLCETLGLPFESYTCAEQVHGTDILVVEKKDRGRGRMEPSDALPRTDALVTNEPDILLNIFVADCVPIILYDGKTRSGGLCHGGWRGTIGEIGPKAVRLMGERFGAEPGNIRALIGPSIGGCCYDVGPEVEEAFRAYPFVLSPLSCRDGKVFLDLKAANREMLLAEGLREDHIALSPLCTSCGDFPLFSYRKDGKETGRFSAFLRMPSESNK